MATGRKFTAKQVATKKYTTPIKKGYHRHHIVPFHAGGANHPWNEEYLLPHEHADKHFLRWVETGDFGDFLAYSALMGWKWDTALLLQEAAKKGVAVRKRMIAEGTVKTSFQQDTELAIRAGKAGGAVGGPAALKKAVANNPEHQSKAGKAGGRVASTIRSKCGTCGFVCRPVNMWRHHKANNHEGSVRIEEEIVNI